MNYKTDIVVIDSGIIGAANARQLVQQYPSKKYSYWRKNVKRLGIKQVEILA
ncbi:MAG: glutamate racemase [Flavobacteriales bacterium]|jgi:glutamate racemase